MNTLASTTTRTAVNWKAVGIFVLISFGLAYALDAILLTTIGLAHPLAILPMTLRMFTPLIATLIVCRWVTHEKWAPAIGLGRASFTQGAWKSIISTTAIGFALITFAIVAATALAIAAGWLNPDWSMSQALAPLADAGVVLSPTIFIVINLVQVIIAALTINAIMAFGEEAGWRGWLQNALEPLGRLRQIILVGAIWGLWHAPLIAAGYNFADQIPGGAAVLLFTAFCITYGAVLSWLSLRSNSVLPATFGHAFFNALASFPVLLVATGDTWDRVLAAPMGLPGALIFAAIAAILFLATAKKAQGSN